MPIMIKFHAKIWGSQFLGANNFLDYFCVIKLFVDK